MLLAGLAGIAVPAQAFPSAGTVTVSYNPGPPGAYVVTPTSLTGSVAQVFTLANTLISGNNDPTYYVALQNGTGSVSLGGTPCVLATDCPVLDLFAGTATGSFMIDALGTIKVLRFYQVGPASDLGTLTLTAGGGGDTPAAAQSYTFRFQRPDGTECSGISPQAVSSGWVTLPGADADCTVDAAPIVGWRPKGSDRILPAGTQVDATGDQTFTAVLNDPSVWLEAYANVADGDACMNSQGQDVTAQSNRVNAQYLAKTDVRVPWRAVCAPPNRRLVAWNSSPDGQGGTVYARGSTIPASSLVGVNVFQLYAMWRVNLGSPVKITWKPQGGTCTVARSTVDYGAAFEEPAGMACTRTGFELSGWNSKKDGSGKAWGPPTQAEPYGMEVVNDLIVYAQWRRAYALTIDGNGQSCTFKGKSPSGQFTLPAAADCVSSLTLMGWNTKRDGTGTAYAPSEVVTPTADLTLYAQWGVKITYLPNGGTCSVSSQVVAVGKSYTLPSVTDCTKPLSAVTSWTTPSVPGFAFPPASTYTAFQDFTFTAQWSPANFMTFNGAGGTCTVTTLPVATGQTYSLPTVTGCTRDGFRLVSWAFKANAVPGADLFFPLGSSYPAFMDFTFYAQWIPARTLAFDTLGGTTVTSASFYDGDSVAQPGSPNREDDQFLGWSATPGGSAVSFPYRPEAGADRTLYALWRPVYDLTFDTGGGTKITSKTFTSGEQFSQPADPTRSKYVFTGWSATADGTPVSFPFTPPASNTTLFALWDKMGDCSLPAESGVDWSYCDKTNANLNGLDLSQANLRHTILTGANLTSTDLSRAQLDYAVMKKVDLRSTLLAETRLVHVDLSGANLAGMDIAKLVKSSGLVFSDPRLAKANMKGARLAGLVLTGIDASGADFSSGNLKATNFSGSTFGAADFTDADLTGASMVGIDMQATTLTRADLTRANLTSADMSKLDITALVNGGMKFVKPVLVKTILNYGVLKGLNLDAMSMAGVRLYQADLSGATLAGSDLTGAYMVIANLASTNLTAANLTSANVGTDLRTATLTRANCSNTNFNYANLAGIDFVKLVAGGMVLKAPMMSWADLTDVNLTSLDLRGGTLDFANARNARLASANLSGVQFFQAKFVDANLSAADLSGSALGFTDFTGADLSAANLSGSDQAFTNFSGANLSGANLSGSNQFKTNFAGANTTGVTW